MPDRPSTPDIPGWLNHILERLRIVERQDFHIEIPDNIDTRLSAYSWQSTFALTTGFGHKLYADRNGEIAYIRAERSSADGTTTASFDVLLDGVTLFPDGNFPTVAATKGLGSEIIFSTSVEWHGHPPRFHKGQNFQVNILTTGGGTGPLRVTIHYFPEQAMAPVKQPEPAR